MNTDEMSRARQSAPSPPSPNLPGAWFVHLYTAFGALAAFFGTLAVFDGRYRESFAWMFAATVVDASDGFLARRMRVREVLPGFDGARLDDIVDYLTFVFLPMLLLYHAGVLPAGWGAAVASIVLLSSAYGFCSADAKTDDHFFTGFPSYWNIVALYLFAARLPRAANGAILIVLSALVFVRIGYVYPSKTPSLRVLTVVLGLVWAAMIAAIILILPAVSTPLLVTSFFYPIYYAILSLALHGRRRLPAEGRP
jgi:phosphatidylcholine synthase